MKTNYNNYIVLGLMGVFLWSCNDNFLERHPITDLNSASYWRTETDLKAYTNGIYNQAPTLRSLFVSFDNSSNNSMVDRETATDNYASLASGHAGLIRIGAGQYSLPTSGGGMSGISWSEGDWGFLRRCNILLENYEKAQIEASIRQRYAGEALFFRAWYYLDKVQNFGDVPYFTKSLTDQSPELTGTRMPRKQVMDSVLRDINLAITFLPDSWDASSPNRVSKNIALTLKSRICLYEGTYRKYHALGDYEQYLTEAVSASKAVMDSEKYAIYNTGKPESDHRDLFIQDDLTGNTEMIWFRKYTTGVLVQNQAAYVRDLNTGVTKDFADDFLCIDADGIARPIGLSTSFDDHTIEDFFNNRDPRFSQIVLDPRQATAIFKAPPTDTYPKLQGMATLVSATGYHLIKYFTEELSLKRPNGDGDAPIFRYAEVLLNYAEARAELGALTSEDLDISVNLLRARAGMPNMTLNPQMDPKYAAEGISSDLVEIRRERRIELCFEQLRYQDLMRWKKGAYLNKQVLGMRLEDADRALPRYEAADVNTVLVDGKKYVDVYSGDFANRQFDEAKNYLFPIPVNAISKNPNLLPQNPGWQ